MSAAKQLATRVLDLSIILSNKSRLLGDARLSRHQNLIAFDRFSGDQQSITI
jgi:hypothetical protein